MTIKYFFSNRKSFLIIVFLFPLLITNAQTWNAVDQTTLNALSVSHIQMKLSSADIPYIAYMNNDASSTIFVKKLNGTTWTAVGGSVGITNPNNYFTNQFCLAMDPSGNPYIFYRDAANSGKACVKKFNGSSWIVVGATGFSPGAIDNPSMVLNSAGNPYVIYRDAANNGRATVQVFNGSTWNYVGTPGITGPGGSSYASSAVTQVDIALNTSGTPYIIFNYFNDYATSPGKSYANIKTFNGTSWVDLAGQNTWGLGSSVTSCMLKIDNANNIFVAFINSGVQDAPVVVKYVGNSFVNFPSSGPNLQIIQYTDYYIIPDNSGSLYFAARNTTGGNTLTKIFKYSSSTYSELNGSLMFPGRGYNLAASPTGTVYFSLRDGDLGSYSTPYVYKYCGPAQPGVITGSSVLCSGNSATYSISAVSGATSYTWTIPSGMTGVSTSTSINLTAGSNAGNIPISVKPVNSCGVGPASTKTIVINTAASQPGLISGSSNVAAGSNQIYSINPVAGASSYTWTLPSGSGWTGFSNSTQINVVTGSAGGNISVVANSTCGNSIPRSKNISIVPPPSISSISPSSATTDNTVTINGSDLSGITAVNFGGTPASSFSIIDANTIIATVGLGSTGDVDVTGSNGIASFPGFIFISPPTVSTTPAFSISSNQATVGGDLVLDGDDTIIHLGVAYNTTGNPTLSDIVVNVPGYRLASSASSTGPFTVDLSNLNPSTTYYVKAYASNNAGTSFGEQISFTTLGNSITVNLKLFLQGYYLNENGMQPVLYNQSVVNSLESEVDRIDIDLLDPNTHELIDTKVAVLQTNGMVLASFMQPPGSYYIAVRHRNSIQTWSAIPIDCTVSTPLYDFSISSNKAYGDNQVEVDPGVWAFYVGDLNQDGYIDAFDYSGYNDDNLAGVNGVYIATDMNGDGYVDAFDYSMYNDNNLGGVTSIHP